MKKFLNSTAAYARTHSWFSIAGCRKIAASVPALWRDLVSEKTDRKQRIQNICRFLILWIPVWVAFLKAVNRICREQYGKGFLPK